MPELLTEVEDGCATCVYFKPLDHMEVRQNKNGLCRRYAPSPLVGGSGTGWADYEWPAVGASDWCGEYMRNTNA